jgi:hypothetical protein
LGQLQKDKKLHILKIEETRVNCNSLGAYLDKSKEYTVFLVDEIKMNEKTIEDLKNRYNERLAYLMA